MKVMAGSLRVMCVALSTSKEVSKLKARLWESATFVAHMKVVVNAFSLLLFIAEGSCKETLSSTHVCRFSRPGSVVASMFKLAWLRGLKYAVYEPAKSHMNQVSHSEHDGITSSIFDSPT